MNLKTNLARILGGKGRIFLAFTIDLEATEWAKVGTASESQAATGSSGKR